jgi:hypothetical protein
VVYFFIKLARARRSAGPVQASRAPCGGVCGLTARARRSGQEVDADATPDRAHARIEARVPQLTILSWGRARVDGSCGPAARPSCARVVASSGAQSPEGPTTAASTISSSSSPAAHFSERTSPRNRATVASRSAIRHAWPTRRWSLSSTGSVEPLRSRPCCCNRFQARGGGRLGIDLARRHPRRVPSASS